MIANVSGIHDGAKNHESPKKVAPVFPRGVKRLDDHIGKAETWVMALKK